MAKINNVAAPSVAAIEKCAIREGENANKASAKFAAVRENSRSAARHTSPAKREAEQDIHGAGAPGQRYRIGRDASDAKGIGQLLYFDLPLWTDERKRAPQAGQRRMVVVLLEPSVTPGV